MSLIVPFTLRTLRKTKELPWEDTSLNEVKYYLIFPKSFVWYTPIEAGAWRIHNVCEYITPYHLPKIFLEKASVIIRTEAVSGGFWYKWVVKDSKRRKGFLTPKELADPKIQFLIAFAITPVKVT